MLLYRDQEVNTLAGQNYIMNFYENNDAVLYPVGSQVQVVEISFPSLHRQAHCQLLLI